VQLGHRLVQDAFPRLYDRRLVLLRDRFDFVLEFGLSRGANRVELSNVGGNLRLAEVGSGVLLDSGYVFSTALFPEPVRVLGNRCVIISESMNIVRTSSG
jgi:hypothetical protein